MVRYIFVSALMVFSGLASAQVNPEKLALEVVANGLERPWALAFLDQDTMLVTERAGKLRVVRRDGTVSEPISGLPAIGTGGQGGLLDLIADRDFSETRRIFFCFTSPDPRDGLKNSTALASARLSEDLKRLFDVKLLFRQTPTYEGGYHFGCRILATADGMLLLGLGDRFRLMDQAQDTGNYIGKVIRISKNGEIPANNPLAGKSDAAPGIWSYGHRNIQGATIDGKGNVWMVEHGPQGGDELNLIEPGANYGWPVITYGENYGGGPIGAGITAAPGMVQPITHWTPSIAPSGLAWLDTDRYGKNWRGSLMVGSLKFGYLVRLTVKDGKVTDQEILLKDFGDRIRDVRLGPDGWIYLLTDNSRGRLLRLKPARAS